MKKILLTIIFLNSLTLLYSQEEVDLILPKGSPFQVGENIEGAIQNSINKATGKVVFSIPVTSISANAIGYGASIAYNGNAAFKQAKNTNEFNPTSILGVGFNFSVPKIVADYKNTAARDDDTFYLVEGNSTKLICTKKTDEYLEFMPEKYAPWKIKYYLGDGADYWSVIKEDGTIYQYGAVPSDGVLRTNAKSYVSTWGNWIGDSNQNPTGNLVTEWYLYKIKDQWNNYIHFKYDKVTGKLNTPFPNATLNKHTEAVYIEEIKSSDNSKITFQYGNKHHYEYYEPHTEQAEPDAYQEKYEKKYLQNIKTFNSNNELIFKYKFEFDLTNYSDPTKPNRAKRYLKKIIQENKNGESLPPQEFQYYDLGDFKGGVKKIIYPTGGEVTYNYKKKTLFQNNANRFSGNNPNLSNYELMSSYNAGNYILDIYKSKNPVSENNYNYKFVRYSWNGNAWNQNEYNLPVPLKYVPPSWDGDYTEGLKLIYGNNYYGILNFKASSNTANLYLFHLKNDGKTWGVYSTYISSLESEEESPYKNDLAFLSGDDFVAIGTKKSGELRTYNWNGTNWNYKYISQGNGEYYYAAINNFILTINEDGGRDLSDNIVYPDNYYIHYLDNEKKWQTKSWTKKALQNMNTVQTTSAFFPSNAMAGFVAHDSPNYFLRWDTNYNLVNVDNVFDTPGDTSKSYTMYSPSRGMHVFIKGNKEIYQLARFNGNSWNKFLNWSYGTPKRALSNGVDMQLFHREQSDINFRRLYYSLYNPNTHSWFEEELFTGEYEKFHYFTRSTSFFDKFLIANKHIYRKNDNPFSSVSLKSFSLVETMPFYVRLSISNGLNYGYASSFPSLLHQFVSPTLNGQPIQTRLYFTNKQSNNLSFMTFDGQYGMPTATQFGGHVRFLNGRSLYLRDLGSFSGNVNTSYSKFLYRIINNNVNNNINDIVIDNIEIDNKLNQPRKIQYSFEEYSYLSNESAFYGKSTIEHKGYGSSNNGKVINFFNTGESDMHLLGTPTKTEVRDSNNVLQSEIVFDTNVFFKNYFNSSNVTVGQGSFIRTTKKTEKIIQENGFLTSTEEYQYNDFGLLNTKKVIYSNNENSITTNTVYANVLFPFLNAKNILNQPAKLVQKKGNDIIGTSETKWKEESGKVFPYQTLAGVSITKILTEITRVNSLGLAEEESNGKGIFNVNLLGYNNKYQVARISNATYSEVISNLDVSYTILQTLSSASLKTELLKLYNRLPKASITLSLYDNNGNLISNIDTRKEEINHFYDDYNRLIYTTDAQGNKLTQTEYKFKQ